MGHDIIYNLYTPVFFIYHFDRSYQVWGLVLLSRKSSTTNTFLSQSDLEISVIWGNIVFCPFLWILRWQDLFRWMSTFILSDNLRPAVDLFKYFFNLLNLHTDFHSKIKMATIVFPPPPLLPSMLVWERMTGLKSSNEP